MFLLLVVACTVYFWGRFSELLMTIPGTHLLHGHAGMRVGSPGISVNIIGNNSHTIHRLDVQLLDVWVRRNNYLKIEQGFWNFL